MAALLLLISQSGTNVVVNGSGTLNTNSLTLAGAEPTPIPQLFPNAGNFTVGATGASYYSGITGPTKFGTGSDKVVTNSTGGFVGVEFLGGGPTQVLAVPSGYVSGTQITDSGVLANTTLAGLGFSPGTYTYTWGTGANADSLTITSLVPEPATWALLGVGAAGLGLALRQRRRSRAV